MGLGPSSAAKYSVQDPLCRVPVGTCLDAVQPTQAHSSEDILDVWIVAGQSNAVGWNWSDGTARPRPERVSLHNTDMPVRINALHAENASANN